MNTDQKSAYRRPEILSLTSEEILEVLGPAQGYGGDAFTPGNAPLTIMPGEGRGTVRRM